MTYDKKVHLIGSFATCYLLSLVIVTWQAALITLILGAAKELIYDWAMKRGTPEWLDFAADGAGVIIALIVSR